MDENEFDNIWGPEDIDADAVFEDLQAEPLDLDLLDGWEDPRDNPEETQDLDQLLRGRRF